MFYVGKKTHSSFNHWNGFIFLFLYFAVIGHVFPKLVQGGVTHLLPGSYFPLANQTGAVKSHVVPIKISANNTVVFA